MKFFWIILLFSVVPYASAQVNCKTQKKEDGSTTTTCYHKNGKASTLEVWDTPNRFGDIWGYNADGKEIFHYGLRKIAGHASVQIAYYANGQVEKVFYSDAPDGGIQFYQSTTNFDEQGNQTQFYETSYPFETTTLMVPPGLNEDTVKRQVIKPAVCATPYTTVFRVVNLTSKKLPFQLKPVVNRYNTRPAIDTLTQPGDTMTLDSAIIADKFLPMEDAFEANLPVKGKKYTLLLAAPVENKFVRVYTWYIVRRK